jgi:hypothetical protein
MYTGSVATFLMEESNFQLVDKFNDLVDPSRSKYSKSNKICVPENVGSVKAYLDVQEASLKTNDPPVKFQVMEIHFPRRLFHQTSSPVHDQ